MNDIVTAADDLPGRRGRTSTGIAGLDDVLFGGWPANHLYLIEGAPGSGKTTLALQYLIQGHQLGERVLYVTLAESQFELREVANSHGMDLSGVEIQEYTPVEESLRKENEYSALYPVEVEFQDTMQAILDKVDQIRPSRLVFDSLSEVRILARDSIRYRRQVLALKHFFVNRNTTVLMLDEPQWSREDNQLQSIAHGVLSLERLERDYGVERRRLRVSKLRGSSFREGYHDYKIDRGGLKVFPRLIASEHRQKFFEGTATSGITKIDEISGGGIPLGTVTMIKGPAGVGKSTITTHYAYTAALKGSRCVLYQFDESTSLTIARSKALGIDLDPVLNSGYLTLKQCDPAELSPGEFVADVRDAIEHRGVELIAIDTINGLLNAMEGEQRLLLQMHELCTYLNQRGIVTFLILSQAGMMGAHGRAAADLSYLADNVFLLSYFEAFGEVRKAMAVLKMRVGKHEPTIRELRIGQGGLWLGEPLREFHGILSGAPAYGGTSADLEGALVERFKA